MCAALFCLFRWEGTPSGREAVGLIVGIVKVEVQ